MNADRLLVHNKCPRDMPEALSSTNWDLPEMTGEPPLTLPTRHGCTRGHPPFGPTNPNRLVLTATPEQASGHAA